MKKKKEAYVLREDADLKEYDPLKNILDTKNLLAAIKQCLIEDDVDSALEIVEDYLYFQYYKTP